MEDSVIGCHGSRLPVHRLVLACHSAPLAALLAEQQRPECQAMGQKEAGEDKKEEEEKEEKEEKEEERGPLVLLDVTSWFPLASDREPVLDALRYIHGQELRLSVKRAGKVLRVARVFRCPQLTRACHVYLARKLTVANSPLVWRMAAAGRYPGADRWLERAAREVAVHRFGDTLRHRGLMGHFSQRTLRWLFQNGLAEMTCENDVRLFAASYSLPPSVVPLDTVACRRAIPRLRAHDACIVFSQCGLVFRLRDYRWYQFPSGFCGAVRGTDIGIVYKDCGAEDRGNDDREDRKRRPRVLLDSASAGRLFEAEAPRGSLLFSTRFGRLWAVYPEAEQQQQGGGSSVWLQELALPEGQWLERNLVVATGPESVLELSHVDALEDGAYLYVLQRNPNSMLLRLFTLHESGAVTEEMQSVVLYFYFGLPSAVETGGAMPTHWPDLASSVKRGADGSVRITVLVRGRDRYCWGHGKTRSPSSRCQPEEARPFEWPLAPGIGAWRCSRHFLLGKRILRLLLASGPRAGSDLAALMVDGQGPPVPVPPAAAAYARSLDGRGCLGISLCQLGGWFFDLAANYCAEPRTQARALHRPVLEHGSL